MTALLPARRRAEVFAEQVEAMLEDQDARADGGAATTFAPLLEVVSELVATSRRGEADRPRASFSAELRERLMLAADTELVATDQRLILATGNRQSNAERRRSRLATAAAALAVVAGTAGVATASSHAVPGQSLYPFKRGFEQAQRVLTFGDAARGRDLLGQARARLDEISRLQAGAGDDSQLPQTISAFIDEAEQGSDLLIKASDTDGDPASAAAVRSFAGPAMAQLSRISASASQSLQPALAQAAMLLTDVDQQAATLCGGCGPQDAMTMPPGLLALSSSLSSLMVPTPGKIPAASAGAGPTKADLANIGASVKAAQAVADATGGQGAAIPGVTAPADLSGTGAAQSGSASTSHGLRTVTGPLGAIIGGTGVTGVTGTLGDVLDKAPKDLTKGLKGGGKNLQDSLNQGGKNLDKSLKDTLGGGGKAPGVG